VPTANRYQVDPSSGRRVAVLTLGCARNEVDSEELAARLTAEGWQVTTDGAGADIVVVNTCGFVASAKQESIDTLLAAADTGAKVVAAGCLAQRYGRELAQSMPEAHAVLSFDDYPHISARLAAVLEGRSLPAHQPSDRRRRLLPISPVEAGVPQHLRGLPVLRHRLASGPVAPVRLASGCDRRCAFCAIPYFRGGFVSRPPDEIIAEARWLAGSGVRELLLVSENSTSYGKDLGDPGALERLLPELARIDGIVRIRVSYLQPAELRPGLVEAIATTPGVAAYYDLSFQHASELVLRRMRRFGSRAAFLALLASVRGWAPQAGIRSNFIVGFPGETRADMAELEQFLVAARFDAVGLFGYSDEEGTEAARLPGKISSATIKRRYARLSTLVEELCSQRAQERVGAQIEVLVESTDPGSIEGRAAHQAPEVDGSTLLVANGDPAATRRCAQVRVGDLVRAHVIGSAGVDLIAVPVAILSPARASDAAQLGSTGVSRFGSAESAAIPAALAGQA
jgi:ribosomal protein S12 methylthiotransferase RimO